MNVIFILIAVSLLVAIGFLITFIWSIRSGQFDDEYTPSVRILFDDETNVLENADEIPNNESQNSNHDGKQKTNDQEPGTRNQEPITNNK